ncbi:MAG TPA: isoprenylcysteine carboxylmethyltransferase family protein [Syntrophomonadaceae bacterium]|nr:isoprenylcysteine carboxylmethyltransferase family protein [Syntrophomonadaceae bacterium]
MENTTLSKTKAYTRAIVGLVVLWVILFLTAGSLQYWQAWIYWTIFSALTLFITSYFFKRSPELLARRAEVKDQETVKKIPAFLNLFALAYLIPGFDFRFHWSTVPVWVVVAANLMVFLGYVFIIIVFKENGYASANIKVEEDQQVISTGPYAIIRHPMYTGLLVMVLFAPLALASYWAVIPALLNIPWTIIRIKNEEELLLRDLPGYRDYSIKTPYRLIPSVW